MEEVEIVDPRRYPKAKYKTDGSICVVANPSGEASLDPALWFDHPNQAKEAKEVVDSDESWVGSEAALKAVSGQFDESLGTPTLGRPIEAIVQAKRRGRPPKVREFQQ